MLREILYQDFAEVADNIQHGVDTAKYYQQAERELEAERSGSSSS